MVYGSIKELSEYSFLDKKLFDVLKYAQEHSFVGLEKGRHDIDGDNVYFNIVELMTDRASKRGWEAHIDYIDVHYILEGCEGIDVANLCTMKLGKYDAERDFLPCSGSPCAKTFLHPGDFLICMPNDAHRPGVEHNYPSAVKKVVFKVKVKA